MLGRFTKAAVGMAGLTGGSLQVGAAGSPHAIHAVAFDAYNFACPSHPFPLAYPPRTPVSAPAAGKWHSR
jgi:hypothetical protein